tara:strand:+ start:848 stop:2137 length:1290 start_codon:yes stop_codon:yes gene_type:complete
VYDPSSIDNRTKISAKFQTKTGELMNSLYQSFTNKNMLQTLTKKGYSIQPPKISRNSVSFDYSNKFTPNGSIEQFHNSEYEPYNFIIQDTTDYKQFMTTHFDKLFKNIEYLINDITVTFDKKTMLKIIDTMKLPLELRQWSAEQCSLFVKVIKKLTAMNKTTKDYNPEQDFFKNCLFTPETNTKEFLIVLDSKDRNKLLYPACYDFVVNFSPAGDSAFDNSNLFTNSNKIKTSEEAELYNKKLAQYKQYQQALTHDTGYLTRTFRNVISVELLSFTFTFTQESIPDKFDKIAKFPYLLLHIPELGGMYEGTNDSLSKSFCKISTYTCMNQDKNVIYFVPDGPTRIIKCFNPRISLHKLTIQVLTPAGKVLYLQDKLDLNKKKLLENQQLQSSPEVTVTQDSNEFNLIIELRVVSAQRQLNSHFLHKFDS